MRPPPESPYRLVVEGTDDLHSVTQLLARFSYDWDDENTIRPFISAEGSVGKALTAFALALRGDYQRLGLIVDANSDAEHRWSQLRNLATKVGVALPAQVDATGTVVSGVRDGTRVGAWIMPDNASPGSLEDFLARLIPSEDACWPYAGEVVGEARRRGAPCKEKDHSKSALHTWLAWQEEPGLPFGVALKAQSFAHDSEDALRFVAWFRRLFVED